ncbi:MAG: AAA family ATPase [Gammaproteobacteria bacterium]|jgi:hypothetical protein
MQRLIYTSLLTWKSNKYRKPLIIKGGRQVGKTYILKKFAKEYRNCIYVNFEESSKIAAFFAGDINPTNIINNLQIHFNQSISPGETLIIFDEIQECPEALNSLKYFNEHANEYHIAAAGSLLGIKLNRSKGFPVGKVDFLELKPLSFFEFLNAMGKEKLYELLISLKNFNPINKLFHDDLLNLLKQYLVIGGMPEAVKIFIKANDFSQVRKIQKAILDAYTLDFAKHAPANETMKIMNIWQSIPNQLAKENKKFIFAAIHKSARAREYQTAIQWLLDAGLIYNSFKINTPKLPLDAYADKSAFKIYMLDVGLLGAMAKLSPKIITQGSELFTEFKGAFTENFVTQELIANNSDQLYYWTSAGSAEVDFILEHQSVVFPLEVKAGKSTLAKSLKIYAQKYKANSILRTNLLNFKHDDIVYNYPLYAIGLFDKLNPITMEK